MFKEEFISASNDLVEDLKLLGTPKLEFYQDKKQLWYSSKLFSGGKGFVFNLNSGYTDDKLHASITYYYDAPSNPFYLNEDISNLTRHANFLNRWVAWAIYTYRLEFQQINLDSIFHGATLRIYGIPGYSSSTQNESNLLIKGIIHNNIKDVTICRFRHIDSPYYLRYYTFAINISLEGDFWIIFPFNCGMDSGGSLSTYYVFTELIEKLKKACNIDYRECDIPYNEIEKYLLKYGESFDSLYYDNKLPNIYHLFEPNISNKEIMSSYSRYEELIYNEEYAQAFRALRVILQQLLEDLLNKHNINVEKNNPSVKTLVHICAEKQLISSDDVPWFELLNNFINKSAHSDYPNKEDMKDYDKRNRAILCIYIGSDLIRLLAKKNN